MEKFPPACWPAGSAGRAIDMVVLVRTYSIGHLQSIRDGRQPVATWRIEWGKWTRQRQSRQVGRDVGRSRARLAVLALITVGTMINYLDRAVLGVAHPSMTRELGLDAVVMGIVFSAFSWTYAAAQIPGGAFLDRVGARLVYFWSVSVWSLFTLLQGLASGLLLAAHISPRTGHRRGALLSHRTAAF